MKLILAFALVFASALHAQEKPGILPTHGTATIDTARHIDFTSPLKDYAGKTIVVPSADGKSSVPLTLGDVAVNALESITEDDRKQSIGGLMAGEEKFRRDALATRIFGRKDVVLKVEEIALLKVRIGEAYGALIVGPAWRLLDPATVTPATF